LATDAQISIQLADIQRTLGKLLADSERADEDRQQANLHRTKVHERIDELREDMNERFRHTDRSIEITGQIAAQARGEVQTLKDVVVDEIKPQTDDFRKMRTMGTGFMMAIALAGAALGVTFSDMIQALFSNLRKLVGQ
jgi:hypothetical protein